MGFQVSDLFNGLVEKDRFILELRFLITFEPPTIKMETLITKNGNAFGFEEWIKRPNKMMYGFITVAA